MKILIVEDDTLLLQGLILAAQTEGYACDGVTTARMAEQSLEAGHYSLVVLDLGLPDEGGLHFCFRKYATTSGNWVNSIRIHRQLIKAGCISLQ